MKHLLLASLLIFPLTSQAETLFYCKTTKGKQVKVTQTGHLVRYTFGRNLKKPELAIKKHTSDIHFDTEMYSGGSASTITIPNGKYSYVLRSANLAGEYRSNGTRSRQIEGSITVMKQGRILANLNCKPSTLKSN